MFTPFTLQQHSLNNRLVVAPMTRISARPDGVPSSIMRDYYVAFARGGFSMVITEGVYTDQYFSQAYSGQPGIVTSQQVQSWQRVVEAVHEHPSLFICQLMHGGALAQVQERTIAPSAVQPLGSKMPEYGGGEGPFPVPAEMTHHDIQQVVAGFVQAARQAAAAGFDGVEIHAANGYLLDQFLTDYTNLRTDKYGGNLENQFRIIRHIVAGIRSQLPGTFLVGLRISEGKVNNLSYRWPGGSVKARQVLQEVKTLPLSYLHIAAEGGQWKRECWYEEGTSLSGLARSIVGIPVIANGGLHDHTLSAELLHNGHADLLALGKAALADPHWPVKTRQGLPVTPFHPGMINPSPTIEHTWKVLAKQ